MPRHTLITSWSLGLLALLICTAVRSAEYEVPLFMASNHPVSESILRIYGIHQVAMPEQRIQITGYDDHGSMYGPIMYYGGRATLSSTDLEHGNLDKGLPTGLGNGEGNWRLLLSTLDNRLAVRVYASNRRAGGGGPLTTIQHLAGFLGTAPGMPHPEHYAALDWNMRGLVQALFVRVFNRTARRVRVELQMVGAGAYGELLLDPYSAITRTADELIEMMNAEWVFDQGTAEPGLILRLVDRGATARDIGVMVLALNYDGSLTNLSGPPIKAAGTSLPPRTPKGDFDISLDFMEGLHENWRRAARYAADRLEQVILSDYPATYVYDVCGTALASDRRSVDDLLIRVEWSDPGPTHISGHARSCGSVQTRGFRGGRPVSGIVTIPWADQGIRDAVRADRTLIHEMLHVLGLGGGVVWERSGYVRLDTDRPSFTGLAAVRQYRRLFPRRYDSAVRLGFSGVPLEDNGAHWRTTGIGIDGTFIIPDDIMLPGGNRFQNTKITAVTVGALADLGYEVDYDAVD